MEIGDRTEWIDWRQQTRTQRTDGGYDTELTTAAQMWASVRPVTARETELASRLSGQVTYLITIEPDELPDGFGTDDVIDWHVSRGIVRMNIREIRFARDRELSVEIVAESGVER